MSSTLTQWSTDPAFAAWGPLLQAMRAPQYAAELEDAFSRVLPFGTGGRRGAVGIGPNRFNPWTLGTSVEGHARFLTGKDARSVVITYDVRAFADAQDRYPDGVESPLDGMTSRSLAELAARIYTAHGLTVWLQPRGDRTFLSTPELSFLIRALGADAGLMISASHNPPDDNGGKFYDASGGQLVPPGDQELLDAVSQIVTYEALSWEEAQASIRPLLPAHHQRYVDAVSTSIADAAGFPVAVTSLHGVGRVHEILQASGFPVTVIAEQAEPDGAFPTVPGHVANPERPEVFAFGLERLTDERLLFATDPDADRIGCMVRHQGGWVFLSGNQLAAVAIEAVLARRNAGGGGRPVVIHTEVSSTLLTRLALARGAEVRNDLLVGFKYIAQVMNGLEPGVFAAGAEESHGMLLSETMRDKDAGGGALWIAVAALDAAAHGATLVDRLAALDDELGPVRNAQVTKQFPGLTGRNAMQALLEALRSDPPTTFGPYAVTSFVDHRDPTGSHGPILSDSDADARNVLSLQLDVGRVILRPSGTEPKLKVYLEALGAPGTPAADVDAILATLKSAVDEVL